MSMTRKASASSYLFLTASLALGAVPKAGADVMPTRIDYSTHSDVGAGSRDDAVSIVGVTDGSFLTPGTFSLGRIQVGLPAGADTRTYNGTPFSIEAGFRRNDGLHDEAEIHGHLDGVLRAGSPSLLQASIDWIRPASYTADGTPDKPPSGSTFHDFTFRLKDLGVLGPVNISVSADGQGSADIIAEVRTVPEPTTLAILVVSAIGFTIRRATRKSTCISAT